MKRTRASLSLIGWVGFVVGLYGRQEVELHPQGDTPTVELRLPPLEGSVVLTVPEVINDATRRLVYTYSNLKHVHWQAKPDGAISSAWRQEGLAAYQLTLRPEADGVLLDWTITNLSPEMWKDSAGNICMQSHGLPAFFAPSGDRIFLRRDGRWVAARNSWVQPGCNWYLPPGRVAYPLMRPLIEDGSWKVSRFQPDEAIVAVQSRDGRWVLAQGWGQSPYFIVNVHEHYQCCEAPPLLGDIGPGQTVHARGKIYWFQGGLDDLESKYQADLKAGNIFFRGPK